MELNSNDIRSLIIELGKIHKELVSLQNELHRIKSYEINIYNGTEFAISSNKLKPKDINYRLKE